ncbi:MAG: flippase [Candidatus Spechtbacterales bacterium]
MGVLGKITFNTIASSLGRVIGGILALASVGFITRGLGKGGFGEYSTVVAYLSTFQILADLGLYSLLTKEISQKPDKEKELVGHYFTLRLFTAALFLFLASILVFAFPYSLEVKMGVVITSSAFLFLSLSQIFLGVFQKHTQVYKAAIAEVLGRTAQLGFVWYFFTKEGVLVSYLSALIVGAFVIFALNLFFTRKLVRFRLLVSFKEWRRITKETLPIAASLLFTLLYFKADTILLSIMKTQEDVGIYSAAYKVLETLIFFPAAFMGLMLPVLSRYAKNNKEKLSLVMSQLLKLITVGAFPVVVGGALTATTVVYFIGGADFLASALPLQILFLATGVIFFGTLFGNTVIALGLQRKAMWAYFAGFVFNFAANIVVIPQYSYIGTAWTTVFTEILVTTYLVFIVRKEVGFNVPLGALTKIAAVTAVMGLGVFYLTTPLQTPLSVFKFIFVTLSAVSIYTLFSWKAGLFSRISID